MLKIVSLVIWPALHLVIYWLVTYQEPWFEPLISERLVISYWQTLPYVALWPILIPSAQRDANFPRVRWGSAAMLLFFVAFAGWSKWIDIQTFPQLRKFYVYQWPLVGLTFWYICHCMLPQTAIPFKTDAWGWFKNSRCFMWAPWLQVFWSASLVGDRFHGEYGQLFFLAVLCGAFSYLPLVFLALLGQHMPGTRTVANLGNAGLLAGSILVLGGQALVGPSGDGMMVILVAPLAQTLAGTVTTLIAYVRLKTRDGKTMDGFDP